MTGFKTAIELIQRTLELLKTDLSYIDTNMNRHTPATSVDLLIDLQLKNTILDITNELTNVSNNIQRIRQIKTVIDKLHVETSPFDILGYPLDKNDKRVLFTTNDTNKTTDPIDIKHKEKGAWLESPYNGVLDFKNGTSVEEGPLKTEPTTSIEPTTMPIFPMSFDPETNMELQKLEHTNDKYNKLIEYSKTQFKNTQTDEERVAAIARIKKYSDDLFNPPSSSKDILGRPVVSDKRQRESQELSFLLNQKTLTPSQMSRLDDLIREFKTELCVSNESPLNLKDKDFNLPLSNNVVGCSYVTENINTLKTIDDDLFKNNNQGIEPAFIVIKNTHESFSRALDILIRRLSVEKIDQFQATDDRINFIFNGKYKENEYENNDIIKMVRENPVKDITHFTTSPFQVSVGFAVEKAPGFFSKLIGMIKDPLSLMSSDIAVLVIDSSQPEKLKEFIEMLKHRLMFEKIEYSNIMIDNKLLFQFIGTTNNLIENRKIVELFNTHRIESIAMFQGHKKFEIHFVPKSDAVPFESFGDIGAPYIPEPKVSDAERLRRGETLSKTEARNEQSVSYTMPVEQKIETPTEPALNAKKSAHMASVPASSFVSEIQRDGMSSFPSVATYEQDPFILSNLTKEISQKLCEDLATQKHALDAVSGKGFAGNWGTPTTSEHITDVKSDDKSFLCEPVQCGIGVLDQPLNPTTEPEKIDTPPELNPKKKHVIGCRCFICCVGHGNQRSDDCKCVFHLFPVDISTHPKECFCLYCKTKNDPKDCTCSLCKGRNTLEESNKNLNKIESKKECEEALKTHVLNEKTLPVDVSKHTVDCKCINCISTMPNITVPKIQIPIVDDDTVLVPSQDSARSTHSYSLRSRKK